MGTMALNNGAPQGDFLAAIAVAVVIMLSAFALDALGRIIRTCLEIARMMLTGVRLVALAMLPMTALAAVLVLRLHLRQ